MGSMCKNASPQERESDHMDFSSLSSSLQPEQTQRASRKTNSLSWYERVFVCIALFGIKRVSGEMEGPCQAAMGFLLYLFALIGALHLLQQEVTGLHYGGALKRR